MTFRAAAASRRRIGCVISVGGDVPPETRPRFARPRRPGADLPGARDEWYSTGKFDTDIGARRAAGAAVTPLTFDGGHEWSEPVLRAAATFLEQPWPR